MEATRVNFLKMNLRIVNQLEANGFNIQGRYIRKKSSKGGIKTVGLLNEKSFFFFASNVYPYKNGLNYFDDSTLVDPGELKKYKTYIKEEKKKVDNEFRIDFETYLEATIDHSTFYEYLQNIITEKLNTTPENYFDLRGISKGYLKGSVAFPFLDYNGNFQTAQLIKYGSNGKRIKDKYSTNWLHSYKDIKEDLKLDKLTIYSKSVKCFFGENYLKGSTNPVAIVEAPKTAVILKEIYPNIDWIATAGEQGLFNKNHDLLKNRNVILFPDAKTTKWKEFAEKKGYSCSDILEEYQCEEGSDLADFIFDSKSEVFLSLHNLLFSINSGDFDFQYNEDKLELNFNVVGEDLSYFTAVPYNDKKENIVLYQDDSETFENVFKGKFFDFYEGEYSVLNAQIDWHKRDRKEKGELNGFNEEGFTWHLQKCYRTMKHLNPDKNVLEVFKKALEKLNTESNFRFNEKYVLRRLVPIWDLYKDDIKRFKKYRSWKYKGNEQLSRKDFQKELNNDKFRLKLYYKLLALKEVLKEERFISIQNDLGISKDYKLQGLEKVVHLTRQWNSEVIRSTTKKQYEKELLFWDKMSNCTKCSALHIETPYRVSKFLSNEMKSFVSGSFSILELSELTGLSRQQVKRILDHKPNKDSFEFIPKQIDQWIKQINSINPIRLTTENKKGEKKTRITDFNFVPYLSEIEQISKHNQINPFLNEKEISREIRKHQENEIYTSVLKWELDIIKEAKRKKERSEENVFDLDLLPMKQKKEDIRLKVVV